MLLTKFLFTIIDFKLNKIRIIEILATVNWNKKYNFKFKQETNFPFTVHT